VDARIGAQVTIELRVHHAVTMRSPGACRNPFGDSFVVSGPDKEST